MMIYLDHAATSYPKPDRVLSAMERCARSCGVNPGRGGYRLAVEAGRLVEETRRRLAELFRAPRPERVVLTLNATDALNMAIKGVLREGDHVITSVYEHNSVVRPLARLEEAGQVTVTRLAGDARHRLDPEAVRAAFRPATRLVILTHASNVTGVVQPVAAVGAIVRQQGALFLVDAAQSAGVVPLDIGAMQVDLLAFAGHKGLLGPMGTGGLVVGDRAEVQPWREGGTGGESASPLHPASYPERLEAGTPNLIGLAGLREGLMMIAEQGVAGVLAHEQAMLAVLFEHLAAPEALVWYGLRPDGDAEVGPERVGLVCFNLPGLDPHDLANILDTGYGVAVRAGLHCAPGAHAQIGSGPAGAVRISVGRSTTADEMVGLARALDEIIREFGPG